MAKLPYTCATIKLTPTECDPCDSLESRVEKLEQCCDEVQETLDTKLEATDIKGGDNITIEVEGNEVTINATGGGGTYTKAELLQILGYEEVDLMLTDTDDVTRQWTILAIPHEIPPTPTPTYRTVLYNDGTFIINESSDDQSANEQLHGQATNVYDAMLPDGNNYVFDMATDFRPWEDAVSNILSVEIGSPISPVETAYWFAYCHNATSFDLANLDTSLTTRMAYMFSGCESATVIDVSNFDTSNVAGRDCVTGLFSACMSLTTIDVSNFDTSSMEGMNGMFNGCSSLTELDLSNFDTSNVTIMATMFMDCSNLETITVGSGFDVTNVTNSTSMFTRCSSIVGGAGTTYNSSYTTKTYARIDNPPDEPGYFTSAQ